MLFVVSGRVCSWRTYVAHIVPEEGWEEEKQEEEGREERIRKRRRGKAGSIMPSLEADPSFTHFLVALTPFPNFYASDRDRQLKP